MRTDHEVYRFGEFTLDAREHRLLRKSREVMLRPKAFATLRYLVERHGHTVGRHELLGAVWPGTYVSEAVLTHCITEIRQALQDDARAPQYLKTLPKVGYCFAADVRSTQAGAVTSPIVGAPAGHSSASVIAVLPFADLNRDEANEIFSDGLTEELINALTRVEGIQVVARTSAFRFKGKTGDARAIAAQLGGAHYSSKAACAGRTVASESPRNSSTPLTGATCGPSTMTGGCRMCSRFRTRLPAASPGRFESG